MTMCIFERSTYHSTFPHTPLLAPSSPIADMLRLDWQHAMNDLNEDWSKKGRFDDLVELEGNVRKYVSNNMADLAYYESECTWEWEKRGVDLARCGIALSDLIRHRLFPYERVVAASVRYALSAVDVESRSNDASCVREGIARMSTSGKLLDAMTAFDGTMDGIDHEGIGEGCGPIDTHAACSRCFRLIVSGWYQLAAIGRGPDDTTSDIRPEVETSVWAERWIDFHDRRRSGRSRATSGGLILPSDEPLLAGAARMISSYARPREWHRTKAAHLNDRIRGLFVDE